MTYDYFYRDTAEQFSFYRIPKALFTEERFRTITIEAKALYGLLLDRMCLSARNGWFDDQGRVYIIFTLGEIMSALGCAVQKAAKLLAELENKAGLIERKRQGLGKPGLIYVKNFIPTEESKIQNCENHSSGTMKIKNQELRKSKSNNTDKNKTEYNDNNTPKGCRAKPAPLFLAEPAIQVLTGHPSRPSPPSRRLPICVTKGLQ